MKLQVGEQLGKYITKQHLGEGSFGTVYEMQDSLVGRDCALKFVENKNPNEFKAHYEGQILHRCRHERIVSVNSVDVVRANSGEIYAVIDMEYCPDGSVQELLEREFISVRRSLKIIIDICFALEHAHRQSILHRDIKPANIMVTGGRYKLSDFGVAKSDVIGSGAGTPVYLAPEVLAANTTSVMTEVFSAGITLFQLCNNLPDLSQRVKSIEVVKSGKVIQTVGYQDYVPRRVRTICNKACAFEPGRRYKNIEEMRQAVERLHVAENWELKSDLRWTAKIGKQVHEMVTQGVGPVNCIYLVNGRRKKANSKITPDVEAARMHQARWVATNTFK
jgi:serine/threonine-protein kinase